MANKFLVNSLTLQMSVVRGFAFFSGKGCILRQTTTTTWAFWRSATAATMKALPHFTFTIASPLGRWTCIASTPSDPIPSFPAITTPQFAMAPASHAQKPWKSERKKHTEEPPPAAASSSPFFGGHSDSLGPKQVHNSGGAGSGRDTSTVLPKSKRTGDDDDVVWTCERSHLQARSKIDF